MLCIATAFAFLPNLSFNHLLPNLFFPIIYGPKISIADGLQPKFRSLWYDLALSHLSTRVLAFMFTLTHFWLPLSVDCSLPGTAHHLPSCVSLSSSLHPLNFSCPSRLEWERVIWIEWNITEIPGEWTHLLSSSLCGLKNVLPRTQWASLCCLQCAQWHLPAHLPACNVVQGLPGGSRLCDGKTWR